MTDQARKDAFLAGGIYSSEASPAPDGAQWRSPALDFDFTGPPPRPSFARTTTGGYRLVDGKTVEITA